MQSQLLKTLDNQLITRKKLQWALHQCSGFCWRLCAITRPGLWLPWSPPWIRSLPWAGQCECSVCLKVSTLLSHQHSLLLKFQLLLLWQQFLLCSPSLTALTELGMPALGWFLHLLPCQQQLQSCSTSSLDVSDENTRLCLALQVAKQRQSTGLVVLGSKADFLTRTGEGS